MARDLAAFFRGWHPLTRKHGWIVIEAHSVAAAAEQGNVWGSRSQISFGDTHHDASIFFGADTYIGPAYFAVGYDDTGSVAFYIFMGRSF